ncbi:AfaD family invasin [Serratia fonticola]|uniref:AfaD family invasin n=1 Tax=Serratia fonticola TaxID=47917 RepID=UPI003AF3B43A
MTATMKCGLTASLLMVIVLWCGHVRAEAPQLTLQVRTGQFSGPVADGTLLAQGTVTSGDAHNGFWVWSDANLNGAPLRYTLSGEGRHDNRINVRLTGRDWRPDVTQGRGMVLMSSDYSASFSVEVDGNQMLPADTWSLQLHAVALLP